MLQGASRFTLIRLLRARHVFLYVYCVGKRRFPSSQSTTTAPVDSREAGNNVAARNGWPRSCANGSAPIAEIAASHATIAAILQPKQLIVTQNTQRSNARGLLRLRSPTYMSGIRRCLARFRSRPTARLQVPYGVRDVPIICQLRRRSRSLQPGTLCSLCLPCVPCVDTQGRWIPSFRDASCGSKWRFAEPALAGLH